jgi:hypothetical protein
LPTVGKANEAPAVDYVASLIPALRQISPTAVALITLPQNEGDLCLRKLRSLYGPSSSNGPTGTCRLTGIFQ